MTRTAFVVAAGFALAIALPAVSAHAQQPRTYVSAAGNDSSPTCSLASPCRHFQAAVSVTSAGGEVDALDPGAYGSFTINHAITIEGQGWSYIVPPANGSGITIAAASSDKISIHGVSINGAGVANTNGITLNTGKLILQNSVVRSVTNGLTVTNTHADVINTDFIGNGTAIFTNGSGVDFGGAFPYPPATTLVRLAGGNVILNTIAFVQNNVGTNTGGSNNRLAIFPFQYASGIVTNTGGNGTFDQLTGTPSTITFHVGALGYGFGGDPQ